MRANQERKTKGPLQVTDSLKRTVYFREDIVKKQWVRRILKRIEWYPFCEWRKILEETFIKRK